MKHIKRVLTIFLVLIIMAASLVPSLRCSHFVYADSSTDQWTTVTTNEELAEAFRYYCKSRNLAIEGSVLDALTTFTTNNFNNICNTLGIDVTALQAHLKRSTDSNDRLQFLFDQFGVTAYNRIFAEFLQNNNLEVGDTADEQNNTLYSGSIFTDADGNNCLVYIFNKNTSTVLNVVANNNIMFGTPYIYNYEQVRSLVGTTSYSPVFHVTTSTYFRPTWRWFNTGSAYQYITNSNSADSGFRLYASKENGITIKGFPAIIYNSYKNQYYVGYFGNAAYNDGSGYRGDTHSKLYCQQAFVLDNNTIQNTIIFLNTNNLTINDNDYTDNSQTVINNEGDVYNYDYDDDDPPINPPSGGGGDNPPTDPDDWGIDLPDLNIDWLLTGKENKFPFNIPFNIILTLSLLNAEPEAPHFEGTIDLGVYQWNYDIDLEQFDPVAEVCRNFEFIAFLIGLMLLTKRLIWG